MTVDRSADLLEAVRAGDTSTVDRLLGEEPGLIGARDADGLSPITVAAYHGREEVALRLLARDPTLDVFEAATVGDLGRLAELLDGNGSLVDAWSVDGWQALMLTVFFGRLDAARLLLDRGARHDLASRNAMTVMPLHSAAAGNHADVIQLLIDRGADVDAISHGGFTALHSAAQNGDLGSVEMLLLAGADRAPRTDKGFTPADVAEQKGHSEVVARLRGAIESAAAQ